MSNRLLAIAVIGQVVQDLSAKPSSTERQQAERFFFNKQGGWAESRRCWCEMAGIGEKWLLRKMQERARYTDYAIKYKNV